MKSNETHKKTGSTAITPAHMALVVTVLLLGFGLQTRGLTDLSLWSDEAWTITATDSGSPAALVDDWLAEDVHPPLFFVELIGWRAVAGDTIFAMRYFSVLLTLAGIALVYRLGRALFSPRAGMLAALFFALHDLVHVFAQEVRHYPQPLMLAALAMWLYWRFWQHPTRRRGVIVALSGAALLWSHYWGGLVLASMGIHALITRRRHLLPFFLAFAGIAVLFAPWLPVLYEQITFEGREGLPHALPNSRAAFDLLAYHVIGVPEAFWAVMAAAGMLGAISCARAVTRRTSWRPTAASGLPALVLVITAGGSIALNEQYATLSTRSMAIVIPALVVLAARALAQFRQPEQVVIVGFVVLHALTTTSATPPIHPPWQDVGAFIAGHSTGDDLILLELNNRELNRMEEVTLAYYLDHAGADVRYISTERNRLADPVNFGGYLDNILAGEQGVWVAKLGWFYYDIRPDLEQRGFVTTAPVIEWDPFIGLPIQVYRYDRTTQAEPRAVYADTLRLVRASAAAHDGWITVNLLWSPEAVPETNYTVSAFVLDANGALASQHDSMPLDDRSPTMEWEAGKLYFDSHTLATDKLPAGDYRIAVKVYSFTEDYQTVIVAPVSDCDDDPACEFVVIDTITITP